MDGTDRKYEAHAYQHFAKKLCRDYFEERTADKRSDGNIKKISLSG
jgi:hypothetical protein